MPFFPPVLGASYSCPPEIPVGPTGLQLDIRVKMQFSTLVTFPSIKRMWPRPYAKQVLGLSRQMGQHSPRFLPKIWPFLHCFWPHRFEQATFPLRQSHIWHLSSGLIHSDPWSRGTLWRSLQCFGKNGESLSSEAAQEMWPLMQIHFLS